jgi:hypothetical protein
MFAYLFWENDDTLTYRQEDIYIDARILIKMNKYKCVTIKVFVLLTFRLIYSFFLKPTTINDSDENNTYPIC